MREILREDDGALLGYVRSGESGFEPLTVFGYPLADAAPEEETAVDVVERTGLERLSGDWEFEEGGEWYRCVILEATLSTVRVRPTDYRYPGTAYSVTLSEPGPAQLRPQ
jgi:hypothetical protein